MLKIKLTRTGKRSQPSYRIIVGEARSKRDGKVLEIVGHYNPLTQPSEVKIDEDRYKFWISKGAKPTQTVKNLAKRIS